MMAPDYPAPGVYITETPPGGAPIVGVGTTTAGFIGIADAMAAGTQTPAADADASAARLCTSFSDFTAWFGDVSAADGQSMLAPAVAGFFDNGGTRCYVARLRGTDISPALAQFDAIDEIAIVAAPGLVDVAARAAIVSHCERRADRFAILDSGRDEQIATLARPASTSYAALYFPWLRVAAAAPAGSIFVPPSGHVAGIYARVDNSRGVHKAPANEVVFGATGLRIAVGSCDQEAANANANGIDCIRLLNGTIRVWGARTLAGPDDAEFKYVNLRRFFIYLRKSIAQGTQWAVFEPNDVALWQKIRSSVEAFLTHVWRDGALIGTTSQQAFYVRCDATTNPPALRNLGQVTIEIGVAMLKPAEFVTLHITQQASPAA